MNNRKLAAIFAAAAALLVWQLCSRGGAGGALDYVGSWQEAQAEAAETKKPILLNFGGPW